MSNSIIIIGAGIAGLAAGCYGQMNGYRTQIFEMHSLPGGLCTSWKRRGYTFDGCIHWLVGTRPGSSFYPVWEELGATQGWQVVDHEEFIRIEGAGGKTLVLYTNADRLEQHMKELAPIDAQVIEELCNAIRRFTAFGEVTGAMFTSSGLLGGIKAGLKMLPLALDVRRYGRMPVQEYATRFRDPFLREAFGSIFDLSDFPVLGMLTTMAWQHCQDAGYPLGGSLAFAQAIERRYLGLSGQIQYKARVEKILVENDRAVGVRLADGTEHRADLVISAADGHATIFDMLAGKYADERVRGYYEELPIFRPMIQVSLGVGRDLSDEPHMVSFTLEEPVPVGGEARERLSARHFCYDPSLAPEGKSVLVSLLESDYGYWKGLYEDPAHYSAEKEQVAESVIGALEQRFPGLRQEIEVVDVATPMTYERYTGNWQGSMEGWLLTTRTMGLMGRGMPKTLPGLDHFYMAGQWVEPGGGVPPAAMSGRRVIQMICREDGKRFKTQLT